MSNQIRTEDPTPYGTEPASEPATSCRWTQDDRDGHWTTDCGNAFEFFDGGPLQNGFRFCPFCGRVPSVVARDDRVRSAPDSP